MNKEEKRIPGGGTASLKSYKGSALLVIIIVTAVILSIMAVATAKVNQVSLGSFGASRKMLQAQQYAAAEASILRRTSYSDVTAHAKTTISNSDEYKSEVLLSDESTNSDGIKEKTATINVYKDSETLPRYTLKVGLSDKEDDDGGSQIVTGMDNVSFTADANYKSVTVIASSKFIPTDSSWTGYANFSITAGGATGTVGTTTTTKKEGGSGHYWGTTENVVNQATLNADIVKGDTVAVTLTDSSRCSETTLTVILGS